MFIKAGIMPFSNVSSHCLAKRTKGHSLIIDFLLLGLRPQQRYFSNREVAKGQGPARLCQALSNGVADRRCILYFL